MADRADLPEELPWGLAGRVSLHYTHTLQCTEGGEASGMGLISK